MSLEERYREVEAHAVALRCAQPGHPIADEIEAAHKAAVIALCLAVLEEAEQVPQYTGSDPRDRPTGAYFPALKHQLEALAKGDA